MKILLIGGGTLGSVTPLLALRDHLGSSGGHDDFTYLFVGTPNGPERVLAGEADIPFLPVTAPKLDRFLAPRLLGLPFLFVYATFQALRIVMRFKPDVMVSAGSYVAVPFSCVGRLLGVPSVLHQMDIRPGLSNMLMLKSAAAVCVSVEGLRGAFPSGRTFVTGIPVRREISEALERKTEFARDAEDKFGLDPSVPTLLVVGGGTGALQLNRLVEGSIRGLTEIANVIHVTGIGKSGVSIADPRYKSFPLLSAREMGEALAATDLIVSRAGMGFISELTVTEKPFVLVPMPDSHQERNAEYFHDQAGIPVLDKHVTPELFLRTVSGYLKDPRSWPGSVERLRRVMPQKAVSRFAEIVLAVGGRKPLPQS